MVLPRSSFLIFSLTRSGKHPGYRSPRAPRPGLRWGWGGVAKSPQCVLPLQSFDPTFLAPVRSMTPALVFEICRAPLSGTDECVRPYANHSNIAARIWRGADYGGGTYQSRS